MWPARPCGGQALALQVTVPTDFLCPWRAAGAWQLAIRGPWQEAPLPGWRLLLAALAQANDLQQMALDPKACLLGDRVHDSLRGGRDDLLHPGAARTDQVVMVLGAAERIGVVTIGMQPFEDAEVGKQVQGAEYRGSPNPLWTDVLYDVVRGKSAPSTRRCVQNRPTRARVAEPMAPQLRQDVGVCQRCLHGPGLS